MSVHPLDWVAREVLRQFPAVSPSDRIQSLGNLGGFSGASLWRVEGASGRPLCLRAWPQDFSRDRLLWIHQLMQVARHAGLDFVPEVFATAQWITALEHSGRLWDLTAWMSGRANFEERPTPARLHAACTALARLHQTWSGQDPQIGPCPAVTRRLQQLRAWRSLIESGWKPSFHSADQDPVRPWAERGWLILHGQADWVARALAAWTDKSFRLQPCLCDIWHDHVLFHGETVTGLIDYGGVKVDHPAVDLARLLGSMIGDDVILRANALDVYARLRPLTWEERELITVLDETGTILGVATWLKWLYEERRPFEDPRAVSARLAKLVARVEKWKM